MDQEDINVVMLFETPSSSSSSNSFHNKSSFKFHDWPPTKESRAKAKSVLGPCRYAVSYIFFVVNTTYLISPPIVKDDEWFGSANILAKCTTKRSY